MTVLSDQLPPGPDWLVKRVEQLERAVQELSAARSSSATSFTGGALRLLDSDGSPRFAAGEVALDGSLAPPGQGDKSSAQGTFLYADNGAIAFAVIEGYRGVTYPGRGIGFHSPTPDVVTSGTFVTLQEATVVIPAHAALYVEGAVQTDVGTTGEIRLREGYSGSNTDVLTVPSGFNGSYTFSWVHPGKAGLYDPTAGPPSIFLGLQARRTGGAGNLYLYPPRSQELLSAFLIPNADTAGHPELF